MRNNTKTKAASKATKAAAAKSNTVAATSAAPETEAVSTKHGFTLSVIAGTPHGGHNTVNFRKSRTAINDTAFNSEPNGVCTTLQNLFMRDVKAAYGKKSFARLDLNAGKLNRAIRFGHIKPAGNGSYALTEKALTTKF